MEATRTSRYVHGQFCWVDLVAHDMSAAAAFYGDLFEWTLEMQDTDDGPPYGMFHCEGAVVAGIGEMSSDMREGGRPPAWNSYVHVDDVHATTEQAESLGAAVVMSPMQVMDAGWLAYIQGPTGATVGLWQDGTHHGAERVNEPGSFCWNELNTRDLESARTFFDDLFGWTYEDNPDAPSPYLIIQNEGRPNGGILEMNEEWADMPPHWMVYFAVENIEQSIEQLQSLGGALHHEPFDTQAGRMAPVADPQGAAFYLIALPAQES